MPHWGVWLLEFLFGSCIGSFLNVCIYRLPREQSIVKPRSRCTKCRRAIAWFDNIPILSFLVLWGECRRCHTPISWRYPVVESLAGVAAVGLLTRFGLTPVGFAYFAFACALIAASFIDLEFQIIPDEISLGGLVAGLLLSVLIPALHGTNSRLLSLGHAVVGFLAGGGVLYLTGLLGDFIFRKESMGGGDIKLLAMAGSILGWKLVVLTFFISPVIALIPGLFVLVNKRSHVIPYGPFLSIGLIVSMFAGPAILRATGIEDSLRLLWDFYGWRH